MKTCVKCGREYEEGMRDSRLCRFCIHARKLIPYGDGYLPWEEYAARHHLPLDQFENVFNCIVKRT